MSHPTTSPVPRPVTPPEVLLTAPAPASPADDTLSVTRGPELRGNAAATGMLDLFEDWARRTPDALAVIDGGRTWTYRQIDAAADETAAALRDRVGTGDLVGVCLDRSAALVVAAVAIARLGAVYLPLGPRPGERRVEAVTEDLDVACLIGAPAVLPARHRTAGHVPLALPEGGVNPAGAVVAAFAPSRPGALRAPHGAFYAVLTSGSTGRPKAVVVAEPALGTLLDWYRAETALAPGDRQSLLIGVAFDPHLMELWAGLTSGAALVPAPDDVRWDTGALTSWWREAAVSVAVAATPMVEPLLERPWPQGLVLRHLVVGGDRMRRRPGADVTATVHNAYGPAEATVVTTTYAMRAADAGAEGPGAPPIGTPVPGVTVVVTGPDGRPVARGEEGELRVGGSGLALGYVDPELTALRFTAPAPGVELPGVDRLYRTGDRVRMRRDGVLEFLGRLDNQVKISGVRIEPAEVEAALEKDPAVLGAVVTAPRGPGGAVRLVAYVRLAPGASVSEQTLLEAARAWLPEQAVPSAVRIVDAFPLDANGKVDRAGLARDAAAPAAGDRADAPEGATAGERVVLDAVRDLLSRPATVLTDDFATIGGTSIVAARLLAVIEQRTGVRLRAPEFLRQPDLGAVAALVDRRREAARRTGA
ncbi:non-ribosomal peptide synthetase [Streptomyces pilosus]|uniref:Amino acid adenylation protein n=1 Tax=Streptomyces pilosus TaxID=28893 RepID=A0A918BJA9_9ACTN|nr:non-ribosomal peptide synthetase [Streptomyces pilosus]GGQ70144.1 amino acid adenylation protein [Streptomyces pilosus]